MSVLTAPAVQASPRTKPPRPVRIRRPQGAGAGAVVSRPPLAGAQRPESWDRIRFRPALKAQGTHAVTDPAPEEVLAASEPTASTMPDPARFAAVVVTAAAEVLCGQRPGDHLARWTTPELFEALVRRAGLAHRLLGRASTRLRPRSVHAQQPDHGTCEVTILLDDGTRVRAAAARLEAFRGRWVLAALEIA
ncbi:Rv3235 family protein [Actinomyces sp. MRS3W]|uniref:Rv3235 family protein n=1 Tax=Actinomyces sp. MRS3W TaxID=2800796 RepID=UPI0028FDB1FC|nr:Rv3235 family protein [Actinomyces sp. MRS3W]MDU0349826.1 Rv3235 family protein [Actinomyces sp. MRS3W]